MAGTDCYAADVERGGERGKKSLQPRMGIRQHHIPYLYGGRKTDPPLQPVRKEKDREAACTGSYMGLLHDRAEGFLYGGGTDPMLLQPGSFTLQG